MRSFMAFLKRQQKLFTYIPKKALKTFAKITYSFRGRGEVIKRLHWITGGRGGGPLSLSLKVTS